MPKLKLEAIDYLFFLETTKSQNSVFPRFKESDERKFKLKS